MNVRFPKVRISERLQEYSLIISKMVTVQEAREALEKRGYSPRYDRQYKCLIFEHDFSEVRFFPKSEWFSGKSVTDGRGFKNLLEQLW